MAMKAEGLAHRIDTVDCDKRYGNGRDHIIPKLGAGWIDHLTMGAHFHGKSAVAGVGPSTRQRN